MTHRRAEVLAWSLWSLYAAMIATSLVLEVSLREGEALSVANSVILLPFTLFATVGAIVAARRAENRIGWLYLVIGLLAGFTSVGAAVQDVRIPAHGLGRPALLLLYGLTNAAWYPTLGLLATLSILWFPDGRPPTRRWRFVEVGVAVGIVGITLAFVLVPGPMNGPGSPANPIGIRGAESILGIAQAVFGFLFVVMIVCSIASFVVRFRRSRGVERQQLRWFVLGSLALGTAIVVDIVAPQNNDLLFSLGASAVPLAAGIAITRYRLYDLDRLISRVVAYLAVSALLVGVYAAIVVGVGALTGRSDNPVVIAGATLAVAAMVRPLLRRAKAAIDRRFNRRRYDAQRALEGFVSRLRDEVALDQVRTQLLGTVRETMQPTVATMWLRETAIRR
jgi:hypothetical protein